MSTVKTKGKPKNKTKGKSASKARHARKKKSDTAGLIAAVLVFVLLVGGYGAAGFYFSQHFLPGTKINGADVSMLSIDEAKETILGSLQSYKLTLNELDNKREVISAEDVGLKASIDSSFDQMLDIQSGLAWVVNVFLEKDEQLPDGIISYQYDDDKLEQAVSELECVAPQYPVEVKNAEIVLKDGVFSIEPETIGNVAHKDELVELVGKSVLAQTESIDLLKEGLYDMPEIYSDDEGLAAEKQEYDQLNTMVISLKFGEETETADIATTAKWVKPGKNKDGSFKLDFIAKEIEAFVKALADKYDTIDKTKKFKSHTGDVVEVNPGGYGWMLDQEYAADKLKKIVDAKKSVSLDLTDGSEASNEWWYRKGVAYDPKGTGYYGNSYAEVSIAEQYMWLYQDGVVTFQTEVVTGNPNLGNSTPTGSFRIIYHQSPATLRGPGYVTDVAYWMVFADDVGFHDATWQPYFGGSLYLSNGSHGCVNLPLGAAASLYELVYDGMPVFVY